MPIIMKMKPPLVVLHKIGRVNECRWLDTKKAFV